MRQQFLDQRGKAEAREKLGFSKSKTIILVSRGGITTDAKFTLKLIEQMLALPHNIYVVVNSGHNKYLGKNVRKLSEKYPEKIKDVGYVENFSDYLCASDLFVCKPGGLNISETLMLKVPSISFSAMPGQEEWNVRFIVKNGLGFYDTKREKIIEYIKLLLENKDKLREIQKNLKEYDHSFSPVDICDEILRRYKKERD